MYTCVYDNKKMTWNTLEEASRFFFGEINRSLKPDATKNYIQVMTLIETQKKEVLL